MRCQIVSGGSPCSSTFIGMRSTKNQASTGMTVSATSSEASSANVTARPKGRKNWLTMPPTKPMGRNTATVVIVLLVMAFDDLRVPVRTESRTESPRPRCR